MEEEIIFSLASEIANKISSSCNSAEDSQRIMELVRELLEIRWSIYLAQS